MRILHVGKYYPPHRGGMETALQHLAEGLLEAGADVSVITAGQGAADTRETLRAPGTDRTGTLLRAAVWGIVNSQPLTPGLVGLLRREMALFAPDVVHLHLPNPLAAAAWLGLEAVRWEIQPPLAVWYHADITRQKLGRRLLAPLLDRSLSRATGISVASRALRDRSPVLARHRDKVEVIPFGITPDPWRQVVPTHDGPFLFVGRLVRYKGVDLLIEALAAVPGARLDIVGEGPDREDLARLVEQRDLADRVTFRGTLDEAGIAERLSQARALVLPSIDESEAFGLVQLEAMAAGVPVVTTDLPTGVPEVGVPEETSILIPPRDVGELAGALRRLVTEPELAHRLGAAGRRRFEAGFTRERMIARVGDWYLKLMVKAEDRGEGAG